MRPGLRALHFVIAILEMSLLVQRLHVFRPLMSGVGLANGAIATWPLKAEERNTFMRLASKASYVIGLAGVIALTACAADARPRQSDHRRPNPYVYDYDYAYPGDVPLRGSNGYPSDPYNSYGAYNYAPGHRADDWSQWSPTNHPGWPCVSGPGDETSAYPSWEVRPYCR
jgi:hypothetical protein